MLTPSCEWLLPPQHAVTPKDIVDLRVSQDAQAFFDDIQTALFHGGTSISRGTIVADMNLTGSHLDRFRDAWGRNDLDWIHAQLLRSHPGYRFATDRIRNGGRPGRNGELLSIARALGQCARFPTANSRLRMGDSPVSAHQLDVAMHGWVPSSGAGIQVSTACELAMQDTSITPYRFQRALTEMWDRYPDFPFEPRVGGHGERQHAESVAELHPDGTYGFAAIMPGALTFGYHLPISYIVRTQ